MSFLWQANQAPNMYYYYVAKEINNILLSHDLFFTGNFNVYNIFNTHSDLATIIVH